MSIKEVKLNQVYVIEGLYGTNDQFIEVVTIEKNYIVGVILDIKSHQTMQLNEIEIERYLQECNYKPKITTSNEKQTTPIQELIEFFENYLVSPDDFYMHFEHYKNNYLKKERDVIENAFVAGDERGTKDIPFNAEQYYNQTFK